MHDIEGAGPIPPQLEAQDTAPEAAALTATGTDGRILAPLGHAQRTEPALIRRLQSQVTS